MIDFQEDFIKNLKFYRKERNISQEKLAEMCDCGTSTIGCIECGRQTPSFDNICKIATALGVHPADLFLRNASSTVNNTKTLLKEELLPLIENFIEKKM
ncbi:MAG: helix-turn-helix domain-containing protein [Treponema sp.]|nr:helix-turn-helix domain-containing protein [Treponema sp.]